MKVHNGNHQGCVRRPAIGSHRHPVERPIGSLQQSILRVLRAPVVDGLSGKNPHPNSHPKPGEAFCSPGSRHMPQAKFSILENRLRQSTKDGRTALTQEIIARLLRSMSCSPLVRKR